MRARLVRWGKQACVFFWAIVIALGADAQIGGPILGGANVSGNSPIGGTTVTATTAFRAPDGSIGTPSYGFTTETNTGIFKPGASTIGFTQGGTELVRFFTSGIFSQAGFLFGTSVGSVESGLVRDAANVIGQKNAANAQAYRWYFNTTGPIYTGLTARTAGAVIASVGGSMQLSFAQPSVPTCTTNCGTPGNVCVGTDTAMVCTMGTTPASGFQINFIGTWPAAPACVVQMALAGMVVGKQALTAVSTTTSLTVVTNGTAPVAGDKYAVLCMGVS